jgi:outer membrane protein TolC
MAARRWAWGALGVLAATGGARAGAQISFYTATDLAVRNSAEVHMAEADVRRAKAGLEQTRDPYLPSMNVGSSVGYSYGFPVGQPSVVDVSASSLVVSFSQPQYIRSARAALQGAQNALKDTKQKVIAEAASEYVELDTDGRELEAMDQQHADGERLMAIERERMAAGLGSQMDETRTELDQAQLELRRLHLQKHAALLRAKLAHLTGLPEDGIDTEPKTIPEAPAFTPGGQLQTEALNNNSGLEAAEDTARAKMHVARGDELQNYRPQASFGIQYSLYAKFNNYQAYYLRFQYNNFDVGLNMSLPVFDAVQRAKGRASAADAVHAEAQAQQMRVQLAEQVQELEGSLEELAAQQKVARLQSELAREQLASVETQLESGTGAARLTPMDEESAKIAERQRYTEMLDADLQLREAQINLLRATGQIEDWARQAPQP